MYNYSEIVSQVGVIKADVRCVSIRKTSQDRFNAHDVAWDITYLPPTLFSEYAKMHMTIE